MMSLCPAAFGTRELTDALAADLVVAAQLKDPLAALDRALLFLHENQVIELQQGLGVFHQAMTIRLEDAARRRRYGKGDFEPLAQHYRERVFQVHVMQEYARLGLERIGRALAFVLDYFTRDRRAFVERWFPDRDGYAVARLSRQAAEGWRSRLARVEGVRVVAMVRRFAGDSQEEFRRPLRVECWEVPLGGGCGGRAPGRETVAPGECGARRRTNRCAGGVGSLS